MIQGRLVIQKHRAKRRGLHYDIRLDIGKPTVLSFVMNKPTLPEPKKSVNVVQTPNHPKYWMDFQGEIAQGYGAGTVEKILDRPIDVLQVRPDKIKFNIYDGRKQYNYALILLSDDQDGKIWKLINYTPTSKDNIPQFKRKYKDISKRDKVLKKLLADKVLMSAKIDGAHSIIWFPKAGAIPRVFSYRKSKTSPTGLLEYSWKIPDIDQLRVPKGMGGSIMRGEIFAVDRKTGKALPTNKLGRILNSNVWKSRDLLRRMNADLKVALFDIEKYKGKDFWQKPYEEKLKILSKIVNRMKRPDKITIPPLELNPSNFEKFLEDIRSGKIKETQEGAVIWHLLEPKIFKYKFAKDYDVYIRKFFEGQGKFEGRGVGGFYYSWTPRGKIVGKVGSGFSDALRIDMYKHPDRYLGKVAVVKAQEKLPSGALRAPVFIRLHLDKNDLGGIEKVADLPPVVKTYNVLPEWENFELAGGKWEGLTGIKPFWTKGYAGLGDTLVLVPKVLIEDKSGKEVEKYIPYDVFKKLPVDIPGLPEILLTNTTRAKPEIIETFLGEKKTKKLYDQMRKLYQVNSDKEFLSWLKKEGIDPFDIKNIKFIADVTPARGGIPAALARFGFRRFPDIMAGFTAYGTYKGLQKLYRKYIKKGKKKQAMMDPRNVEAIKGLAALSALGYGYLKLKSLKRRRLNG